METFSRSICIQFPTYLQIKQKKQNKLLKARKLYELYKFIVKMSNQETHKVW